MQTTTTGVLAYYFGEIEYANSNLEAIYHADGRIVPVSPGVYEYHYYLKDHLGNTRAVVKGTAATPVLMQEYHYYPFGMQMDGAWLTPTGLDQKYRYNGKELVDDLGLNWYDYGARWYDPSVSRWMQVDPLTEKYASFSGYNYVGNNPVRMIDPDGMASQYADVNAGSVASHPTDYYNQEGELLGTDGIKNGKVVIVTDKKEAKAIKKADKAGGTTPESDVKSGVAIPSAYVRSEMEKADIRSGDPSDHEEGGFYGTTSDGKDFVVHAKPGPIAKPGDPQAGVSVMDPQDPSTIPNDDVTIIGTFHTHPSITAEEKAETFGSGRKTTTTTRGFQNEPSPNDYDVEASRNNKGNSYVLAKGNSTVYVYNGTQRTPLATFPLKEFYSVGTEKK